MTGKSIFKLFLIFAVYAVISGVVNSSAYADNSSQAANLILTDRTSHVALGRYLHIIEDPDGTFKPEEVLSKAAHYAPSGKPVDVPNFGFKKSVFWIVFSLSSRSANTGWVLELVHPLMDSITVYEKESDGIKETGRTGLTYPFFSREELHRNFIFFMNIKYGDSKTIIMRLRNDDRMEINLNLWSNLHFYKKDREDLFIIGIFTGFVLLIIIFHIFLYFNMREQIYIAYVPFVFLLGVFILLQGGVLQQYLWPAFLSEYLRFVPALIGLLLIAAFVFLIRFLDLKKLSPFTYKVVRTAIVLSAIVAVSQFIIGYRTAVIIAVGWTVISVIIALLAGINSRMAGSLSSWYYILSWGGMFLGGFVYALKAFGVFSSNPLTANALHIGALIQFIVLSFGIGDRIRLLNLERGNAQKATIESQTALNKQIEVLNSQLRRKLDDLDSANKKIGLSEERYRFLVEGTDEIIFSLDESMKFISMNRAVTKIFGVSPEEILGRYFLDLIHQRDGEKTVGLEIVRENLNQLFVTKEPVKFRAEFLSSGLNEPREMQIRLEFLNIEGKNEILGKASPIQDDFLMRYFVAESQKYVIGNYLHTADEITRRLTRNLIKYFEKKDIAMIRLALREIVINAIEHGNLEVTYEDKTKATIAGNYLTYLSERQKSTGCNSRIITIDYTINEEMLCYIVEDQGRGFNYNKYMSEMSGMANETLLAHGRGLLMTSSIFDRVTFNDKGNAVTLVKMIAPGTFRES